MSLSSEDSSNDDDCGIHLIIDCSFIALKRCPPKAALFSGRAWKMAAKQDPPWRKSLLSADCKLTHAEKTQHNTPCSVDAAQCTPPTTAWTIFSYICRTQIDTFTVMHTVTHNPPECDPSPLQLLHQPVQLLPATPYHNHGDR